MMSYRTAFASGLSTVLDSIVGDSHQIVRVPGMIVETEKDKVDDDKLIGKEKCTNDFYKKYEDYKLGKITQWLPPKWCSKLYHLVSVVFRRIVICKIFVLNVLLYLNVKSFKTIQIYVLFLRKSFRLQFDLMPFYVQTMPEFNMINSMFCSNFKIKLPFSAVAF